MITPSKVISIDESVLGHLAFILQSEPYNFDISELFHANSEKFESISQFLLALDVLFVLGRINVNFQEKKVIYAR